MPKTRICPICGAEFQTTRPNKRYCSFICKEAARQLQRMTWNAAHPGYHTEYMRRYRGGKTNENADRL